MSSLVVRGVAVFREVVRWPCEDTTWPSEGGELQVAPPATEASRLGSAYLVSQHFFLQRALHEGSPPRGTFCFVVPIVLVADDCGVEKRDCSCIVRPSLCLWRSIRNCSCCRVVTARRIFSRMAALRQGCLGPGRQDPPSMGLVPGRNASRGPFVSALAFRLLAGGLTLPAS